MTAAEKLRAAGYDDVLIFENYSYDEALVGVTDDNRAVYEYNKMITWLMETEGLTLEDAVDWVEYNTIRALPYMGSEAPIVMYRLTEEEAPE